MGNKKYKLTQKTLGDVFEDKVIYTDTLDLIAYILSEAFLAADSLQRKENAQISVFNAIYTHLIFMYR